MKKRTYTYANTFLFKSFVKTSVVFWLVAVTLVGADLFGASSNCASSGRDAETAAAITGTTTMNSTAAAALKVVPSYTPLPPGAVRPTGWLLDWAKSARDGITGHLDERNVTFREGWSGKSFDAPGARQAGTGWPLEQCSYWLDGLVRLGYALQDDYLVNKARSRLDPIVQGVLDGGPSLIYWRPEEELDIPFNNWAHSHMGRALVAYYQASGDPRILEALVRVYRDFPLPDMHNDFTFRALNGSVNIDPMLEVFTMSGDLQVLETVLAMTRRSVYRNTVDFWLQERIGPGHGVIYYENLRVPALLYPWTGDQRHLNATQHALDWHDRNYMLPVGVCSSEEYHAGIGCTRNIETCNVSASIWTYLWLLRITGQQGHADRIEQVFFNAGPAPIARDFQTMCYYQSPNRFSTSLPAEEPRDPSLPGSYLFTEIGHSTLCCVGNSNRFLPFYITHMWMATADDGLAATLYGPCQLKTKVGDSTSVNIQCQTSYPFQEEISLTINPKNQVRFPLHLRVPGWCREPSIQINGRSFTLQRNSQGFAILDRLWKPGDNIVLNFPMTVSVVQGRETPYPQIPRFDLNDPNEKNRQLTGLTDINNPFASVYCGPILFALGIPDENPNKERPDADYQYALDVTPLEAEQRIEIIRRKFPEKWQWQLDAPFQLKVPVVHFDWQPTEIQPLPVSPVEGDRGKTVTLVPYGCTKFRVSMFPVTKRSWHFDDIKTR